MCYLPIHAAMVAFLFNVMGAVPRTETEIYKHFTRFTLMRSLSKHSEQDLEEVDTDKLSGEESKLFGTICEVAFNQTVLNKQVLDQEEMNLRLQSKNKDISLGLVTVDRTAGLYGYKNIYTFLHLTYQEYLAAHHISILSDEDQLKVIREHKDKDHMQVVWKFYCGLVKFKGQEHKIKALFAKRINVSFSDIQCAYESQQKIVCECIVKATSAQIVLEDKFLLTSDFTALGYLLANSSESVSLSLTNCNVNDEAVYSLLKETDQKPLNITKLYMTDTPIGMGALLNVLQFCEGLKSLTLICSIKETDIETLLTELKKYKRQYWPNPRIFELQPLSFISSHSITAIAEYLSDFSTLEKLVLSGTIIDDRSTLLASNLSHSTMLHHVELSNNRIDGTEGIKSLLTGLTGCSNLQVLVLTKTCIMSEGACVLASCFQHWPKLQELHMCGCGIGEEGAEAIDENLRHCPKLVELDISYNNVGYHTIQKIQSKLQAGRTTVCCTLS